MTLPETIADIEAQGHIALAQMLTMYPEINEVASELAKHLFHMGFAAGFEAGACYMMQEET